MAEALVTAPAKEPLSLTEAKLALRREEDFIADDAFLTKLIKGARLRAEKFLNRKLITQTWAVWFAEFPGSEEPLEIPFPPLVSVTHLKYVDTAGATQTWSAAANYLAQTAHDPGRIIRQYGISWPSIRSVTNTDADMLDGPLRVQFTCGYGANGSDVPQDLRDAMQMDIGFFYNNREADTLSPEVQDAVNRLLWPERIVRF